MSAVSHLPVNWPASGTTSQAYKLEGQTIVGFYTASTITSTSLTFQAANTIDGSGVTGSMKTVKAATGGSAITFTVTTSGYYGFTADLVNQFRGVQHFQIVGGSSESAGQQVILAIREVS